MGDWAGVRRRFHALEGVLDERSRRLLAAAESKAWGVGGISAVARVTGMSRPVIRQGLRELSEPAVHPPGRIRSPGGGRKKAREKDPTLVADLEKLVEPVMPEHPEVSLRWTSKGVRKLAEELHRLGHRVSYPVVGELLHELNYSLQPSRKTKKGEYPTDHHAQVEYLNSRVQAHLELRQLVISVDTKKKDWTGATNKRGPKDRKNVRVHDFAIPETGRDAAYGVYDLADDTGWVSVALDPDTSSFAVETIRRWWYTIGQGKYPRAQNLLIAAASGSNWSRAWLWRAELQKLARETGLIVGVSHLPPGTSKWNKIEHRMFSFISHNWRGWPLTSLKVTVDLIAGTTPNKELNVPAESDWARFPGGIRIPASGADIRLQPHAFHDEWNYEVLPGNNNSVT